MRGEKDENLPQQKTQEWELNGKTEEGRTETDPEIKEKKFEGFRKSREYWAKMWKNSHKDWPNGPGPIHDTKFKEKWESLQKEGKTSEEIFEILKKENPSPFMWIPFMKHMSETDNAHDGKSNEDIQEQIFTEIKKYHFEKLTPEQKSTYEQMKSENREIEFWRNQWEDMHKDGHCKSRWMGFMRRRGPWRQEEGRSEGDLGSQEGDTHRGRHRHWGHWGWRRCGSGRGEKSSEDRSLYQEFDC